MRLITRSAQAGTAGIFTAIDRVTAAFWERRRPGQILIGGCGFWLLVAIIWWAWYLPKAAIYAVIMCLLFAALIIILLTGMAMRPAEAAGDRKRAVPS